MNPEEKIHHKNRRGKELLEKRQRHGAAAGGGWWVWRQSWESGVVNMITVHHMNYENVITNPIIW